MLHTKWLYQKIHKIHHKHISTLFYAYAAAHPLEYIFGNVLPTVVGVLILGKNIHVTTVIGWYIARSFETLEGHCGYDFSWSPFRWVPFSAGYGYHVFHHSVNVGNYSSFFHIWDTILGSNSAYTKHVKEFQQTFVEAKESQKSK